MYNGVPAPDGRVKLYGNYDGIAPGDSVYVAVSKGRDYVTKVEALTESAHLVDVVKLDDLPFTFSCDLPESGKVLRMQIRVKTADEAMTFGRIWLRSFHSGDYEATRNHRANRPRGKAAARMRKRLGLEDVEPTWKRERNEPIERPQTQSKTEEQPIEKPTPPKARGSIDSLVAALVRAEMEGFNPSIDEDQVLGMIDAKISEIVTPVTTVEIKERGEVVRTVEQAHKALPTALSYAQRYGNVFLSGPAGCGKGKLGQQVAESLGMRFGQLSLSEGVSEGQLTGRGVPLADAFHYIEAQFVSFFETGGVFMLDEVDAADPNVLLVINEALANGTLSVPNREEQPTAERHEDFVLLVSANTWGTGPDAQYTGRNRLDAAFLDRFAGACIYMDYDHALEESIVRSIVKDADSAQKLLTLWHSIRRGIRHAGLQRVWSTRGLRAAAIAVQDGDSLDEVLDAHTVTWPEHDRKQVAEFASL